MLQTYRVSCFRPTEFNYWLYNQRSTQQEEQQQQNSSAPTYKKRDLLVQHETQSQKLPPIGNDSFFFGKLGFKKVRSVPAGT